MPFIEIAGPVVSDTAYCDDELVAKDVTLTLPEVSPTMVDIAAMGTSSIPIWQYLEDMEAVINKVGVDMGISKAVRPESQSYEFRWVQLAFDKNGNYRNVGCKAFIRGIPKKIPGIELTPGESPEGEIPIAVTRYALYVDGEELWLIDRLSNILKINGKDYSSNIESML